MDICTEEDLKKGIAHYMGQIRYVDDSVGRILRYLKENNLDKDTVILFFADHGELLGSYNMTHKIPVFYDCLSKIPVILYHPEKYHGIRFKGLVEEVDIVPTLLDMLEIIRRMYDLNLWSHAIREKIWNPRRILYQI